jgi:hypothetical protein
MQQFRQLKVWQRSHALVKQVYGLSRKFPADERLLSADLGFIPGPIYSARAAEIDEISRMLCRLREKAEPT